VPDSTIKSLIKQYLKAKRAELNQKINDILSINNKHQLKRKRDSDSNGDINNNNTTSKS